MAALHAAQPGWQIDWVVDPRWRPLLVNGAGAGPVVGQVHLAETRLWSRAPASRATLQSIRSLRNSLRAQRYHIAVDMQGTLRSAVIARLSGAAVRAGYADPRERQAAWFYTQRVPRTAPHVVEQGFELLQGAFGSGLPALPAVRPVLTPLPTDAAKDAWAVEACSPAPLCVLAPGAGWAAKQWPADSFAGLARALHTRGVDVVITAARADDPLAVRVAAESGGAARVVDSDVGGLLALVRRAALVVGGDSGPVHLAAALGTPVVALFGPTDPARNGPWGAGPIRVLRDPSALTSYRHTAEPDRSLARLTVQQVTAACHSLLPA